MENKKPRLSGDSTNKIKNYRPISAALQKIEANSMSPVKLPGRVNTNK